MDNLLLAWQEFLRGKRNKKDIQKFQFRLMDNILSLHQELINGTYRHGPYYEFRINDPKPRIISKASVRDRLLHHAVYWILYPFFDKTFIVDSFSCRKGKGTHRAMHRFREFGYAISKNNTKTCWVLKCDIKKFFHSIDHDVLIKILQEYVPDERTMHLLKEIISSFYSDEPGRGLPLGNLTSQLFCNIYMNEFDQFVKHRLKAAGYVRYADDFVVFSSEKNYLESILPLMEQFLSQELSLRLHPDKIFIKTLASGIDFLGWVHFPDHRIIRTATKKRMLQKLKASKSLSPLNSYVGMLEHGNAYRVKGSALNVFTAPEKK